jgi:hypothetical protein
VSSYVVMTHPDVAGTGTAVDLATFYAIWEPRGWVLSAAGGTAQGQMVPVVYAGALGAARPPVAAVVWIVFVTEPTNYEVATDIWVVEG